MIEFLLNNEKHRVPDMGPCTTALDCLRNELGLCGTKEGCAAGDCGACTVVVSELNDGDLHYRAVNACIMLLPTLHGKQLITVEHIGSDDNLYPIQRAMVENHASQCGFCTPGFVMSLFALSKGGTRSYMRSDHDGASWKLVPVYWIPTHHYGGRAAC
jgi:xanthine dehydrogenase iron-sulfur cluster and FAD-binding subunit A